MKIYSRAITLKFSQTLRLNNLKVFCSKQKFNDDMIVMQNKNMKNIRIEKHKIF